MELRLKEGHAYYDRVNKRVTIHYRYGGELVGKIIFNFKEGSEDRIDGDFSRYAGMTVSEEKEFLREKRSEAWQRMLKVPKY